MKLIKKLFTFLREYFIWRQNDSETRSEKEIGEIWSICEKCPHFVRNGGMVHNYDKCGICECNLHPNSTIMNKIAWKTTSCPDDPPRW